MKLTYAIIGTGGIGGFYGGKLAKAGHDVHFLFNSDYSHVLKHGLRIDSKDGNFELPSVNAYNSAHAMPKADIILVGLKTTNNHLIKDLVDPILKENSILILIQNGLGVEEELSKTLENCQIGGGLAFICSEKIGPGHIHHQDFGRLILGSYNITDLERLQQISTDFINSGIRSELAESLNTARWKKLVWNIPFNGMTVVLNTDTKQLVSNENSKNLIHDLIMEVIEAGRASGAPMDNSYANDMIEMTIKMQAYSPSMKVDYDHHRPLEIESIYSHPILVALSNGYRMHKVELLEQQLRFLEEQQKSNLSY